MTALTPTVRKAVLSGAAALTAAFFLSPYLVMLFTSLKPTDELFSAPVRILPQDWTWSNFVTVWQAVPLLDYVKNSLLIAGVSTIVVICAAVPAAYCTARLRFRGRNAFLSLVLITQMFAPIALLIGLYREFVLIGLVDSLMALIITNAAFNLAFAIWILNGYFISIPVEIEEAAAIDGCNRPTALLRVVLPLALPGVVTAIVFTFIVAWNEYVVALTLINSPENRPLTLGIAAFMGRYTVEYQYLFAASLIAIVPVVILFALIEKHLVTGLTAGSIK